jgi:hypothetical protein
MRIFTTIISLMTVLLLVFVSMVAIIIPFSSQECQGFSPMPIPIPLMGGSRRRTGYCSPNNNNNNNIKLIVTTTHINKYTIQRRMVVTDNDVAFLSSDDPFVILGLDEPTADKKVLKRAYKRRAMKFHPDVITDIHSPPEEKKKASDRFAKINWAYATLTGKNKDSPSSSSTSQSSSSSGYTPPHRRSGGYSTSSSSSSSSSSGSNNWRDYMPDYGNNKETNNDDYDTGGDSFGQIFSDFFTSAAVGAAGVGAGSTGIFSEFVDFLEGNVGSGGSTGGVEDDANLRILLKTGSLEEVAEEMDDTELVVRQLESKATILDDERFATDAEAKMASKFSEKIELEERAAELKARKDIVGGFLKRARTRLLTLQTRYKELITYDGANDSYVSNGRSRSRRSQSTSSSSSSSPRDSSTSSSTSSSPGRTSSTSSNGRNDDSSDDAENSWKNEGFGSSGRSRGSSSRGSGRRRAARRTTTTASSPSTSGVDSNPSSGYSSPSPSSSPSRTTDAPYSSSSASPSPSTASGGYTGSRRQPQPQTQQTTSSSSSSSLNKYGEIPPHRRTQSYVNRQEEDKQRMREIKVDEEFDKLKKELGL